MRIQQFTNQPNLRPNIFGKSTKDAKESSAERTDEVLTLPKEKPESKQTKTGSAVAILTLAVVCSTFMLSRGFQKNASKYLNKFKDFLEEKMMLSSLKGSGKTTKFYEFLIRRINSVIRKSKSINNITSLKDILFMKLMYKTRPTKQLHEAITKKFENISRKTVSNSYKKTEKSFSQMNKKFDELDDYILNNMPDDDFEYQGKKYTRHKLVELAKGYRKEANEAAGAFIDNTTRYNRYGYMNDVTSSLYSTFWDVSFKDFWSKNNKFKRREMWQEFIAAEQIRGSKTEMENWIACARNAITYTKSDQASNIREYVKALDGIVSPKDTTGIKIIERLEWFVKNPEVFQNNIELFLKELKLFEQHPIYKGSDEKIAQTLEKYKQTNIDFIRRQMSDNEIGAIQDMLSIYYKIAPYELDKSGAMLSVKKAVRSFDKAAGLESEDLFDKLRDLKLGSAPTDILTILFSFVMLTIGLGHAKDKDKRRSIMLKSGIPIVGGIAASIYTATKLVSGGKSLAFGILSGVVLNQLGNIADGLINKHIRKHDKETGKPEESEQKNNK